MTEHGGVPSEQERSAHLAAVVDASSDAILSKTLTGTIRSWNASAERIFGYAPEEIVGTNIRRLIPDERQAEEDEILARLRQGDHIDHYETVRLTKDGQRLDVSLSISPIRDPSGRITGASKIIRDITARKEAEDCARRSQRQVRVCVQPVRNLCRHPRHSRIGPRYQRLRARSRGYRRDEAARLAVLGHALVARI